MSLAIFNSYVELFEVKQLIHLVSESMYYLPRWEVLVITPVSWNMGSAMVICAMTALHPPSTQFLCIQLYSTITNHTCVYIYIYCIHTQNFENTDEIPGELYLTKTVRFDIQVSISFTAAH